MKKAKVKMKGRVGDNIVKAIIFTVLAIYALSMIVLLVWGFMTSLKNYRDFSLFRNVVGLPSLEHSKDEILFGNYIYVLKNFNIKKTEYFFFGSRLISHETESGILKMLLNTFIYAGVGSLLSTICSCTVGFLCAKYKFKFSKMVYTFALFMMIIPVVGSYPSMISMLRGFGIYDTYFTHIIQKFTFGGMYYFVFLAFFEGMSDAYFEAAEIDGASQFRIYLSIVLPLAIKIITSVTLINFVSYWNDYTTSLLYTPTIPTLATGVYYLCYEGRGLFVKVPVQCAACMILAIPILILFIFLNKRLMGNISMGGVKE